MLKETSSKKSRAGLVLGVNVVLGLLGIVLAALAVGYFARQGLQFAEEKALLDSVPSRALSPEEDASAQVLAETDVADPTVLRSENFRVGQLSLGGDVGIISDSDQRTPLTLSLVRGEVLSDKNNKEAQVLITWQTSKAALASIEYAKNTGEGAKVFQETGYGTNHSAVIPGLEYGSTYLYSIVTRDRWGNEVKSDSYAIYTGAKTVSLFELIANALGEIFGWALKK